MSLHQIAPVLRRLRLIGTSPGIHNTNTNNSNNNNNTNDNNNNNNNNRSASLLFGGGGGGGGEKDNSLIMGSTLSSLLIRACSSVDASNETLVALVLAIPILMAHFPKTLQAFAIRTNQLAQELRERRALQQQQQLRELIEIGDNDEHNRVYGEEEEEEEEEDESTVEDARGEYNNNNMLPTIPEVDESQYEESSSSEGSSWHVFVDASDEEIQSHAETLVQQALLLQMTRDDNDNDKANPARTQRPNESDDDSQDDDDMEEDEHNGFVVVSEEEEEDNDENMQQPQQPQQQEADEPKHKNNPVGSFAKGLFASLQTEISVPQQQQQHSPPSTTKPDVQQTSPSTTTTNVEKDSTKNDRHILLPTKNVNQTTKPQQQPQPQPQQQQQQQPQDDDDERRQSRPKQQPKKKTTRASSFGMMRFGLANELDENKTTTTTTTTRENDNDENRQRGEMMLDTTSSSSNDNNRFTETTTTTTTTTEENYLYPTTSTTTNQTRHWVQDVEHQQHYYDDHDAYDNALAWQEDDDDEQDEIHRVTDELLRHVDDPSWRNNTSRLVLFDNHNHNKKGSTSRMFSSLYDVRDGGGGGVRSDSSDTSSTTVGYHRSSSIRKRGKRQHSTSNHKKRSSTSDHLGGGGGDMGHFPHQHGNPHHHDSSWFTASHSTASTSVGTDLSHHSLPTSVFLDSVSQMLSQQVLRADHEEKISIGDSLYQLAEILYSEGKYRQAMKIFERCCEVRRMVVNDTMASISSAMRKQGKRYQEMSSSSSSSLLSRKYLRVAQHLKMDPSPGNLAAAWRIHREYQSHPLNRGDRELHRMVEKVERRLQRASTEAMPLAHALKMVGLCQEYAGNHNDDDNNDNHHHHHTTTTTMEEHVY